MNKFNNKMAFIEQILRNVVFLSLGGIRHILILASLNVVRA